MFSEFSPRVLAGKHRVDAVAKRNHGTTYYSIHYPLPTIHYRPLTCNTTRTDSVKLGWL